MINLYNTDCLEAMKAIPDKCFDLAHVDPEYGIGEDGRKSASRSGFVRQKNGSKIYVSADKYTPKTWDTKRPPKEYFDELFRVSKHQIIWGGKSFSRLNR